MLIILYGITGTGFAINLHFCSGSLASVKIDAPAKPCGPEGERMKGCTDKKVDVKVKDAHQTEASAKAPAAFSFELGGFSFNNFIPAAHLALLEKLFNKTPPSPSPPAPKVEPVIKNRNLRI